MASGPIRGYAALESRREADAHAIGIARMQRARY